jgi:hypothetical protein
MTVALASAFAATALAQETEGAPPAQEAEGAAPTLFAAPKQAFELDVSTGYSQGFGGIDARPGAAMANVASGGIGVGIGLGYRAMPELSVAGTLQYQELAAAPEQPLGTRVRGAGVGVEGKLHLRPYDRIDPWVGLGAGYRMLWVAPEGAGNNVLNHGLELARAKVGLDVRVSRDVALGPVIGGDVNLFIWRNPEGPAGNTVIPDKKVSTFLFAGVQGRFDIGGQRVERTGTVQLGSR